MLLCNAIQTPDGTILESHHRHDFVKYTDKNGKDYFIDGGLAYCKRSCNGDEVFVGCYSDSPFEEIREKFKWGTRGKYGNEPLKYIPLKDVTSEHIRAILQTQYHVTNEIVQIFEKELEYRG
jgi:hypothetical protein